MKDRNYFRFEELLLHFNITADEILYEIENSQLELAFVVENQKLLVGNYHNDKFEAFGIGQYSGLVSVSRVTSINLFTSGKAKCTDVSLQANGLRDFSTKYPFDIKLPNNVITTWRPTAPSGFDIDTAIGKLNPRQGPSGAAAAKELLSVLKQFTQNNSAKIPNITGLDGLKDNAIYTDDFKFSIEQACILSTDLKRLGLLGQDSAFMPYSAWPKSVFQAEASDPNRLAAKPNRLNEQSLDSYYKRVSKGKRIVSNLIAYDSNATASDLWLILRKAQLDDDLLDLIDPDRDILEVTTDKILWNVPDNAPERQKQITRGRFKNIVTELKK